MSASARVHATYFNIWTKTNIIFLSLVSIRRHFLSENASCHALPAHICFDCMFFVSFFHSIFRVFVSLTFSLLCFVRFFICIKWESDMYRMCASCVDCTFFFVRSIKCLCKARRTTWTYTYRKAWKRKQTINVFFSFWTYIELSYISDTKFICCVFSFQLSIVVSWKEHNNKTRWRWRKMYTK